MQNNEQINRLAEIVNNLIGENEPSDEELNYDDTMIELYNELHNLKECLINIGRWNF